MLVQNRSSGLNTKMMYYLFMSEDEDVRAALKDMSFKELTALQYKIRLEKQRKYDKRGIRFSGYIPEIYQPAIPIVLDFLYDQKAIKKRTIYNLATASVALVIDDVLRQIRESREKGGTS